VECRIDAKRCRCGRHRLAIGLKYWMGERDVALDRSNLGEAKLTDLVWISPM
jgi:hypothetical protein